jgi:hypothetical protein
MHPPVSKTLLDDLAGENLIDKQAFVYSSLVCDGQECGMGDAPIVEQVIGLDWPPEIRAKLRLVAGKLLV